MRDFKNRFFSFYGESNFLRFRQFNLERDILRIAFFLFEAEKRLKKYGTVSRVTIPLSEETFDRIDKQKLKKTLEDLFLLILLENTEINFKKIDDKKRRVKKERKFPKKETICLFSGGVDSFSGIKVAEKKYKKILGVFVAHNDQARIIKIVNNMKKNILSEIRTIYAPGMGLSGYSQLRGFVYILAAGVYLNLCKANKILVTECGPTMYQPLFSPYDSITYTTHPYVLKTAKNVLKNLLTFDFDIILPFEDLTKAEVMAVSKIEDFSKTHSCVSQRFGDHDGTCFGCVIRKLAGLVARINDTEYNKNIFEEGCDQDNLLNILELSYKIITNPKKIWNFQKDKINEFNKWNLFKRYALDNLAGLMLGTSKKSFLYQKYINKDIEKKLDKRIQLVRKNVKKPDFNKIV